MLIIVYSFDTSADSRKFWLLWNGTDIALVRIGKPSGGTPSAAQIAQAIVAGFQSRCSYSAQISTNFDLDTHTGHEAKHLSEQTKFWEMINVFCETLQNSQWKSSGQSLLDLTTIMVISEFSRTPALNRAGGKDHNPLTNSVLLLGAGFKPGLTIGKSRVTKRLSGSSQHAALKFDFESGNSIEKGVDVSMQKSTVITPAHVAKTLCEIFSVPSGYLDSDFEMSRTAPQVLSKLLKY